jgi:hypothetical protein
MPPDPKEPKSPLEVFAEVADKISATHADHPRDACDQATLGKKVARICREEPSRVHVVEPFSPEGDGIHTGLLFVKGDLDGSEGSKASGAGPAIRPGWKGGPAQVATPAYRDGWETIFGKRVPVGQS